MKFDYETVGCLLLAVVLFIGAFILAKIRQLEKKNRDNGIQ